MNGTEVIKQVSSNIETAVIGKSEVIKLLLTAFIAGGHILIEDLPGVGKTTLANALAKSINSGFTRIQFTPDTLPSDITGMTIYNMHTGTFEFSRGAVMNNIILADELNRTSPKTQASLLEAMEERQVTVDGKTYPLPAPFMVIATQNPVDYLGTYSLPEAQLDRFMMKLSIGYPDENAENEMITKNIKGAAVKKLEAVTDGKAIEDIQKEVLEVEIHKDIVSLAVNIVNETRRNPSLALGASPRAAIALAKASQAWAYIDGRNYVSPDDMLKVAPYVLTHRLIVSSEAKLNKQTAKKIITDILSRIKLPEL
jgi:MoxR-like ATPase